MNPDEPLLPDSGDDPPQQPQAPQHISARVPDRVGRGVFSTGMIAMTSGNEFILDFVQSLGGPAHVVARVVMPHGTLSQFIEALRKNLEIYQNNFGQPPELPRNKPKRQPSIQEVYDELKMPDEMLSGSYANGVMIGHTASEFKFDFLTNLFPTTAVSCRVFLSTPQVPRMLESLKQTFSQFEKRIADQRKKHQQGGDPPEASSGDDNPTPSDDDSPTGPLS